MNVGRLNSNNKLYTPASGTTVYLDYSPQKKILEIEFSGGKAYHYLQVEATVWEKYRRLVLEGGSSGEFINKEIKPNYQYRQINF